MRKGSEICKKAKNYQKSLCIKFSNTLYEVIKTARILRGKIDKKENSCTCKKGFGTCSNITVWQGENYTGPLEWKLTPKNHSIGQGAWEFNYGGNNGTVSCNEYCTNRTHPNWNWPPPKDSTCTKSVVQRTGENIPCGSVANQHKGAYKGLNPVMCTCSPPIRSMRIPDGCKVDVYANTNETGPTREYLGPLSKSTLKGWNNQIRSLVITSTSDTKKCNPC